jgi:3-phosphoshikimate 1-carboxyvinyltransferase
MAALADKAEITLKGLKKDSGQGDKIIAEWMRHFGVESYFMNDEVQITKKEQVPAGQLTLDFTNHPDLVQVMLVTAAASNVKLHGTGIRNLRIKETDRIEAMRQELIKLNARLDIINDNECFLYPDFRMLDNRFKTYNDHRMVLALAPLAVKEKIVIEDPLVVRKSYPEFWEHLQHVLPL